jgi:ribonucleoside-diphosphate reductase alpha chain/ribonucleoside-triphosphate reductase
MFPYYIRRVRMATDDKLVKLCRDAGYHVEFLRGFDGKDDRGTSVVSFPCETPKGALLAKDVGVIQQLEMVKKIQTIWSDNAVSVTAYYEPEELPLLKDWLKANYETGIKSVSFLLRTNHGFDQPPYSEITEEQYHELTAKISPLSSESVAAGEMLALTECSNGVCPVR